MVKQRLRQMHHRHSLHGHYDFDRSAADVFEDVMLLVHENNSLVLKLGRLRNDVEVETLDTMTDD